MIRANFVNIVHKNADASRLGMTLIRQLALGAKLDHHRHAACQFGTQVPKNPGIYIFINTGLSI